MVIIPDEILIHSDFFSSTAPPELLQCRVTAILRDRLGDQYAVFEPADMAGLYVIHLGSNFFRGWANSAMKGHIP